MSQILTSIKNHSKLYHISLFGLLVTFIIFIIQYMEGIKKNFLDINILLIAYSAILIIPFYNSLLNIIKGEKIKTYLYQLVVFIFYIINTSTYGSLNYLHPIKGDIVSIYFIYYLLLFPYYYLLLYLVLQQILKMSNIFFHAKLLK